MANTLKLSKLKEQYNFICNEYVSRFCNKQGVEFFGWVGDTVGGIALCSDYYLNHSDIVWDINSRQPKGLIFRWYNDCIEIPENAINYFSYTKISSK